jgi:hypothetical protein
MRNSGKGPGKGQDLLLSLAEVDEWRKGLGDDDIGVDCSAEADIWTSDAYSDAGTAGRITYILIL